MTDAPGSISLTAEDVRFEFVAAYFAEGLTLPVAATDAAAPGPTVMEIPSADEGVTVQLVPDPNSYFREIDRRTALATMMLRAI